MRYGLGALELFDRKYNLLWLPKSSTSGNPKVVGLLSFLCPVCLLSSMSFQPSALWPTTSQDCH